MAWVFGEELGGLSAKRPMPFQIRGEVGGEKRREFASRPTMR